jgi:dihydropteroate synthase
MDQSTGQSQHWQLSDTRAITLDRPCVVCIVNATPDSFSDGGKFNHVEGAVEHIKRAIDQGADMLDIGGESTRPGAQRVDVDEQVKRVVPIIEAVRCSGIDIPISIDTTRSAVARSALESGADAVNDVSAMTEDPEMLGVVSGAKCGVVLMHRLTSSDRDSYSDQYSSAPEYGDVVDVVREHLAAQREAAIGAGVVEERIVLDPGLGFGKSVEDNLRLIHGTERIVEIGSPVMSGLSRKSFVGRVGLGRDSDPIERDGASVGLSVIHMRFGARIFRVHDVGAHRAALDAAWAAMTEI